MGFDNDVPGLLDHICEVEGDEGFIFGYQNLQGHAVACAVPPSLIVRSAISKGKASACVDVIC
jgi:hypothetical protein